MADNTKNKPSIVSVLVKYVLPLIVSVGLCWSLFSTVDFNELIEIIKRDCNFWWIGLTLLISIFSHVFRAMRWQIQLNALNINAPLTPLIFSIFGTYAVNLVLPRAGELWRTGYIAQRQKAPLTTVFGSMVADRLADTVTVAFMTLVTFFLASGALMDYFERNSESFSGMINMFSSPWFWSAIAGSIAAIALVAWLLISKKENKLVMKIRETIKGLWEGFAVVAKMDGVGRWLILTVLIWGCYFMQLYVAFYAFPFTTQFLAEHGAIAVLVCFVLSSLAMGVPSNGGIGPWQYAICSGIAIYTGWAVKDPNSLAFANLVMGAQTILLILLGILTFAYVALTNRQPK